MSKTLTKPIPSIALKRRRSKVISLLQINEMNDMTENFSVKQNSDGITIEFSYDRELNLVYKKTALHYEKTLRLN